MVESRNLDDEAVRFLSTDQDSTFSALSTSESELEDEDEDEDDVDEGDIV
jgi:hypothetical protein